MFGVTKVAIGRGSIGRALRFVVLTALLLSVPLQALAAPLTPSTFEGDDGNIVVNTPGNIDWVTVAASPNTYGFVPVQDILSSKTDNALGQGSKEDDSTPQVVMGSIPPNKSNLTRMYAAHETVQGQDFLYLAWERSNVLGTANMDFEIHKGNIPAPPSSGTWDLQRSDGDILITFDFTQGGGNPVLGMLTWLTTGPTSRCYASNALPCWGNPDPTANGQPVNLSLAGDAEGQVNQGVGGITGAFTDNLMPTPVDVAALEFGEASINLDKAGIFKSGECDNLGGFFLKSRSSASFTSEIKDFIAPGNLNIHNCGALTVKKVTIPSPDLSNTSFHFDVNGTQNTGTLPKSFDLLNGGSNTTQVHPSNDFSVAETLPANWVLKSATCTDDLTGTPTGTLSGTTITGISVASEQNVTCTFTNQALGAIKVTKTTTKGNLPLSGVTFSIAGQTKVTDANGVACVDNLAFGDYTVTETAAPAGYQIDDPTPHTVTVNTNATCSSGPANTIAFTDTPLSKITVSFQSLVTGATSATIQCTGESSPAPLPEGTPKVLNNLVPGTYTCTVVVDP